MPDEPEEPGIPVTMSVTREPDRSTRTGAPYMLGFTKRYDELSASTNVEWLTRDELAVLRGVVDAALLPEDGVAIGAYSWGRNVDGKRSQRWQVIRRFNDSPKPWLAYTVVLEVDDEWQARAIAVILNSK